MNHAAPTDERQFPKPILPAWIMNSSVIETPENAAFASGSALALLHIVLNDPTINVPLELLRSRLALRAAVHCLKLEGRGQAEADIRDAYLLTVPGDAMGPGGDMVSLWRQGCSVSLLPASWRERLQSSLPEDMQEHLANWIACAEDTEGNPVAKSVLILTDIIRVFPRHEAFALLCADVVLARSFGWDHPYPLFGLHLSRKALRAVTEGEDIGTQCHFAVARAAQDATRLTHDLARRAALLRAVAPKLRSKGSDEAVKLFLSEDAVLPSTMLSPTIRGSRTRMTARSARRLCDRLVGLGVVRELTGRTTFRLYGVA